MTRLTVDLPDEVAAELARRAAAEGYGSPGEYLAALARVELGRRRPEAHEPHSWAEIQEKVFEALSEDGPRLEMTAEEWESLRREGRERLAALKRRRP